MAHGSKYWDAKHQHDFDVDMLQREQQFNADQAQVAYDRQREFYNMQFQNESEYNSPLSQMQRYMQAGMNPAMMNLNEGNTNVSASSPSAASASGSNTVNMAALQSNQLQAIQNVAGFLNEFQKVQSEVDLNKTQAAKNVAEADKIAGVDTDKAHAEIKNVLADTDFKQAQKVKTEADTELSKTQKENVAQETENLRYSLKHLLPKQSRELEANIKKIYNDIENSQQMTKAQCAELFQNIRESVSRVELNNRQSDLVWKEIQSFDEKLQAELDVSREQFQQLKLGNWKQQQVNDVFDSFMKYSPIEDFIDSYGDDFGIGKDGPASKTWKQAEMYFKLFQLKALNTLNFGVN